MLCTIVCIIGWICATIVPFCTAERWISWHLFNETQPFIPPQSYYSSSLGNHIRAQWNVSNRSINTQSYQELYFDEAIEAIYRHQHPQDCSNVTFLTSLGFTSGFGSEAHVETMGLAIAMELGRVYLPARHRTIKQKWQTPFKICNGTKHQFRCYFEPWTNCTYTHVDRLLKSQSRIRMFKLNDDGNQHFLTTGRISQSTKDRYSNESVVNLFISDHHGYLQYLVPSQMNHIVSTKMRLTRVRRYYWWRAVAAAYLLRPNDNTMRWVSQYSIPTVQSLQGKCVSMYIRHGDKAREMKLIPFEKYMDTAKSLWIQQYGENSTAVKTVMLGTETPRILNQAMKYQEAHPEWKIIFNQLQVEIFRKKGLGTAPAIESMVDNHNSSLLQPPTIMTHSKINKQLRKSINVFKKRKSKNKKMKPMFPTGGGSSDSDAMASSQRRLSSNQLDNHNTLNKENGLNFNLTQIIDETKFYATFTDLDYISFIVNLVDLMRCDIFVCTLASNYCRVLDELRAVVAAKPDSLFADLSYETCTNPPCVGPHGFKSFDW